MHDFNERPDSIVNTLGPLPCLLRLVPKPSSETRESIPLDGQPKLPKAHQDAHHSPVANSVELLLPLDDALLIPKGSNSRSSVRV